MSRAKTKKDAAPEPMDPAIREQAVAVPMTNTQRTCHAIKQLVSEVDALFPETPVEFSNHDGRNTALDVTFDLTGMDNDDTIMLIHLLGLTESDERIDWVLTSDDAVLVSFKSNPRTQDSRAPFGLADAMDVLAGIDEVSVPDFFAEDVAL